MELDVGQSILLPPGGGEVVGGSQKHRRVELLSDGDELHTTWTRFRPQRLGAELHVHRGHTDLFYVLEGELTVMLGAGDHETVAQPGSLVVAPPLVVHGFRNASDAELIFLNFHAPGAGFAEFMRGHTPGFDSEAPPADGARPIEDVSIGTGEVLSDRPGLRVSLLADLDELGIAEVTSEPGAVSPPLHVHRRHVESYYVLAGELSFTAGAQELRATAGSWVQVPPNVPHTFAPTGSEKVRFLNIHAPSCGFGNFVRALNRAQNEDELARARAEFDQEPA